MALPTTNLQLHCDASDTDHIFTTFSGSGNHTGTPTDGSNVEVWDDEGDGIADVIMVWNASAAEGAEWRTTTPLMPKPCLDFDGSTEYYVAYNQTGSVAKTMSNFFTTAFTIVIAFYGESMTSTDAHLYNNNAIIADSSGNWGVHVKNVSGQRKVYMYNYDGAEKSVALDINENTAYVFTGHKAAGSATMYASINGGTESSTASVGDMSAGSRLQVARGFSGAPFFNGRVGEFALYNAELTGSNLTDANSYFTNKWLPTTSIPNKGYFLRQAVNRAATY